MSHETHSTAAPETTHDDHAHSDTVTLPVLGTLTVAGGIYTVVFVALGVLTLIEVLIGGFPEGFVKIVALLAIAVLKALLVIIFYMHLRTDNRLFAVVLALPLVIVLLSILYLLAVPIGEGLGYLAS
jgi:cytochrome c oxidase subunit 4